MAILLYSDMTHNGGLSEPTETPGSAVRVYFMTVNNPTQLAV